LLAQRDRLVRLAAQHKIPTIYFLREFADAGGLPALDDDPWCRPRGVADLSRHRRCPRSVPQVQVQRCSFWADVCQVSIGRGRLGRQNIALWRSDDADDALRSSSSHDAFEKMVMA